MPVATALPAPAATVVCTNASCVEANTHRDLCECTACDGEGHGLAFMATYNRGLASMEARIEKAGGVFAMLATAGGLAADDDLFGAF